jgi:peptidylamidoglycolate lyase
VCLFPTQEEFQNIFSSPSKKIKTPDTQTNPTKTVKLNNDNGLQTRWTRTPAGNSVLPQLAVTCKIEAECSYQTFVQVDSEVLRNRQLRQHAKRYLNSWGANYFIMPHGLTVDKDNNIWVTDVGLHQIFKFSHNGQLLMTLGVAKVSGNDSLHFNMPTDVAIANDGSFYVSDGYGNSRIVKFSPKGKYLLEWGTYGNKQGEFDIPHAITLDNTGNVYVADRENNRIQVFDSKGEFLKDLKNNEQVAQIPSVTIDKSQNLFAIDYDFVDTLINGSTIFQYDKADKVIYQFGGLGTNKRTASWYHDISVDKEGSIYVGDIHRMKIHKFKYKPTNKK